MHRARRGHNSPIIVMVNYSIKMAREGKRFGEGELSIGVRSIRSLGSLESPTLKTLTDPKDPII